MANRPYTENNLGYNQLEIDSFDQHSWRNERIALYSRVEQFCLANNILFTHRITPDVIQSSQQNIILFMILFDLTLNYDQWKAVNDRCQQQGKIALVVTDNILHFNDLPCVKFFSYPKLLGMTASYDSNLTHPTTPGKLYNCFIQRVDSVRQTWFYFLHQNNLLDQGYVSLLLKQVASYSALTGKDLYDYIHKQYQLNNLPHFEEAYQKTKDLVPYRNFEENNNLLPYILDSKYSVVLETYATDDDRNQWCFTEKSLRAIQFPTIPLLFVQRGGIGILKSLGFEINHSMDWLDTRPWPERQQQLLKILIEDSVDLDPNTVYNQCLHNQELLASWKKEYQDPNFFNDLYTKATTL